MRIPPLALISLITASVPLGLAQGALDDIHAIAAGKVPLLASALAGCAIAARRASGDAYRPPAAVAEVVPPGRIH